MEYNIDFVATLERDSQTESIGLTDGEKYQMYLDGRTASPLAEIYIGKFFKQIITRKDAKGIDFVYNDKKNSRTIECKLITHKSGLDLAPSHMKGKGRKFDKTQYEYYCDNKDFCVVDATTPMRLRVIFVRGEDYKHKNYFSKTGALKEFFKDI